jgi:hypothetical protein
MQPAVDDDGLIRPMTRSEFTEAMSTLLAEQPPLFFCYLEFTVPFGTCGYGLDIAAQSAPHG